MKRNALIRYALPFCGLALLAPACTDDATIGSTGAQTETDTGTETTGDGDGDPTTTGDGDGDPTTTTTTGDGDGDPTTTGDGDGDPATGDGDGDPTTTTGDGDGDPTTTGDGDGDGDPLEEIPPEEWEPIENPDGVPSPIPGVYDDLGAADPNDGFRALIGLDMRDREDLVAFVDEVSDPTSDIYGQYMTPQEIIDNHAPFEEDFELLQAWLDFEGLSVNYVASNRMLIQFSGLVGQFNEAFNTTLHVCMRKNPQQGNPPIPVYCTSDSMTLPLFVADRSPGLVTADLPAEVGDLPNEAGAIEIIPPNVFADWLNPDRVHRAYNVDDLHAMGYDGTGQKIGVIMGAMIHYKWAQTFWQSWGIVRSNPTIHLLMEDPVTRYIESQLDNTWAGAVAPGAELVGYEGPDSRNTSMVFVFNEAVTRAPDDDVWVITNSFAHREDSEPKVVRDQYDHSALFGAAAGLTLLAATGDSARPDTPSSSPYVTGVGGTNLYLDGQGNVTSERTWNESGSGVTISFDVPWWQEDVAGDVGGGNRVTADVSASGGLNSPYFVYYNSQWNLYGGTSFSSPVWAGIIACVNQMRLDNGMDRVGYLNTMLYTTPAVQDTFRDITQGGTDMFNAEPGWDPPTGWGSPDAVEFALTVPSP